MPKILCIETATEVCSVAISSRGKLLALEENHDGNAHASQLHNLVQKVLDSAGITLQDLDAVAVSKGPGSYTGLRVGVSTAKGYCYALGIPLIAINTLESLLRGQVLGEREQTTTSLYVPMLDARRMEVYCAVFDRHANMIRQTEAKIIDETSFVDLLDDNEIYFIGNGAAKCKSLITHPHAKFLDNILCSAKGMVNAAFEAFQTKQFEDTAYFEPFYLKDFVGTTPKKLV
jgi:tRNA threonylcarbamoyladenosine biosynthesis protein TsaB